MEKEKIIKVLKSLPQEFYEDAYSISVETENRFSFQMKYNAKLIKTLKEGNRWTHRFEGNGFVEFIRNDNIKIIMT